MPSSRPAVCRLHASRAKRRVCVIQAASTRPASSAAHAKLKGIAKEAKPASTTGGGIRRPPSRKIRVMARAVRGGTETTSDGVATTGRTKKKQGRDGGEMVGAHQG